MIFISTQRWKMCFNFAFRNFCLLLGAIHQWRHESLLSYFRNFPKLSKTFNWNSFTYHCFHVLKTYDKIYDRPLYFVFNIWASIETFNMYLWRRGEEIELNKPTQIPSSVYPICCPWPAVVQVRLRQRLLLLLLLLQCLDCGEPSEIWT